VLNEYKDWHAYYFLNYDGYEVIDAVSLLSFSIYYEADG
jgi:hypothetical protein